MKHGMNVVPLKASRSFQIANSHSLTPWHYSPDGRKPPLIRFHSLIQCICGASGKPAATTPVFVSA
jgi:hypothetical protein